MNSTPTLAVVAFPGNNCEVETARAAERNGFKASILRWNQVEEIGAFDAYILPGGFSFEDRGRSGSIAAREPIFDALREEVKAGKLLLGICNGAQMIVESGLIPVAGEALPYALADNVRRDNTGHVIGTGYYNVWNTITPDRKDTAFTNQVTAPIKVPIAHGEGRFTTTSSAAEKALTGSQHVAFRYCDVDGKVSADYPITPNGAAHAVAMIVNAEGTVGAIMPHPERFPMEFEGDQILQSMHAWIIEGQSPATVEIGDLATQAAPTVKPLKVNASAMVLEKTLIITDNEGFSVNQAAESIVGKTFTLDKSFVYVIEGEVSVADFKSTGLIANPNKENLVAFEPKPNQFLVELREDDPALHLAEQLTEALKTSVTVRRYKAWNFDSDLDATDIEKVLTNGLLCNPHSGKLRQAYPDYNV